MPVDDLTVWSILLMFCSLVLFIEAISFARALSDSQRDSRRFFLFLILLAVSMCSIMLAVHTAALASTIPLPLAHVSMSTMQYIRSVFRTTLEVCQIQVGISIAVFILMLLLERMFGIRYVSFLMHSHQREGVARL